jgi:hypothetical protein
MTQATFTVPVKGSVLEHEVRDPRTGETLGWINGDWGLQEALRRHGFRLVSRRPERTTESRKTIFAGA